MVKKCSKCERTLDVSKFNWKIKNVKYAVHCKDCSREYIRQHYYKNKQYYLNKAYRRNKQIMLKSHEFIGKYLSTHPCVDCGEKDVLVLEFDHKDKDKKYKEISRMIKDRGSLKRLIIEIDKCDVRCANCHRRKTAKEDNSWKLKYLHS